MSMNNSRASAAQAAQQANRDTGGRYATKVADEAGVDLIGSTVELSPASASLGMSKEAARYATHRGIADALRSIQIDGAEDQVVFFINKVRDRALRCPVGQLDLWRTRHDATVVAVVAKGGIESHDPRLRNAVYFDEHGEAFCRRSAPSELRCFDTSCDRVRHYGEYPHSSMAAS